MAKPGSAGKTAAEDWRALLAAAVVEFGTRKIVGPYALKIPAGALRTAGAGGTLAETELPNGDRLLTFTPPRPASSPATIRRAGGR